MNDLQMYKCVHESFFRIFLNSDLQLISNRVQLTLSDYDIRILSGRFLGCTVAIIQTDLRISRAQNLQMQMKRSALPYLM